MLQDANLTLRAVLAAALPIPCRLEFGPARSSAPEDALGAFVFDVAEDISGRTNEWTDVRDERGRVVARSVPGRRYRVHYLLWAESPAQEHQYTLLGQVLTALSGVEVVPENLLRGALVDAAGAVRITVAPEDVPGRKRPLDVWPLLDRPARPSLELVLTTALPQTLHAVPGAPTTVDLGLGGR
ncbi:Pvc16 family protein [Streptomyces vinaceus]|uniref:Pvc16 family protein n=1 Tax=Streptomyces vinaceus TaxID=1960 RepID=UPI0038024928